MRRRTFIAPLATSLLAVGLLASCAGSGPEAAAAPPSSSTTTTEPEPVAIAPLTGLALDDRTALDRPALVVKIDNHNAKARPQVGLDAADVVFEELVEGGATRFAAVFHSTAADPVGPVRSARTTDVDLVSNLNKPLFAWAGANTGVRRQITSAPLVDVGWDRAPGEYYRARGRSAPNNVFTRTSDLFDLASDDAGPPPALFEFRADVEALPSTAVPMAGVALRFGGSIDLSVEWRWDPDTGTWLRTQAGTPHTVEGGTRISAHNVIVQFVRYHSSGYVDVTGAASPEAEMIGEGEAWVLTDGRLVRGTWSRAGAGDATVFTDGSGERIALTPGRTWVELAPPGSARVLGGAGADGPSR